MKIVNRGSGGKHISDRFGGSNHSGKYGISY